MQILVNDVPEEELDVVRVPTDVSKAAIRAIAEVKSVDVAFLSTSVRRADISLDCTTAPTEPTAPSAKLTRF